MKQSISTQVTKAVQQHVDTNGSQWLLGLGYMECNDFAESIRSYVSASNGGSYIRFETVARNIRAYKAKLRKTIADVQGIQATSA